jgi:hypothetical protein
MKTKNMIVAAALTAVASSVFAFNEDLVATARSYGAEGVLGVQTETAPVKVRAQGGRVDDLSVTAASYGAADIVAGARHPDAAAQEDGRHAAQHRDAGASKVGG